MLTLLEDCLLSHTRKLCLYFPSYRLMKSCCLHLSPKSHIGIYENSGVRNHYLLYTFPYSGFLLMPGKIAFPSHFKTKNQPTNRTNLMQDHPPLHETWTEISESHLRFIVGPWAHLLDTNSDHYVACKDFHRRHFSCCSNSTSTHLVLQSTDLAASQAVTLKQNKALDVWGWPNFYLSGITNQVWPNLTHIPYMKRISA